MAAGAPPPPLCSTVELFLSARNLRRADLLSASDPFAVVRLEPRHGAPQLELGRTETVRDNDADPAWAHRFTMEFHFEEPQVLHVSLWDDDGPGTPPDPLGQASVPLGRLMAARGQTLTVPLEGRGAKPGGASTLTLRAGEVTSRGGNDEFRATLRCAGLPRMNLFGFGSSDPFLRVSRLRPDGGAQLVLQTPPRKGCLDPAWGGLAVRVAQLCAGDPELPLRVEVWDWEASGRHRLMCSAGTSLNGLLQAGAGRAPLPLEVPGKPGKSGGTLAVEGAAIVRIPSLLDYLAGGLQLQLMCAVDFTGSNGDPRLPSSLHYAGGGPGAPPNEYVAALTEVGRILLEYDADKRVPMLGFGGAVGGTTRHCFALSGDDARPEAEGLDGMLAAYYGALARVGLSGPTLLEPVIRAAVEAAQANAAARRAGAAGGPLGYTILLVLTDGQANDIDATAAAVVEGSALPLSIVIVGVGGADFSAMEFLDGDEQRLRAGGRVAVRDCVQFVPFRECRHRDLAAQVLAEIPGQVVEHFMAAGVPPPPPLGAVAVPLPAPAAATTTAQV